MGNFLYLIHKSPILKQLAHKLLISVYQYNCIVSDQINQFNNSARLSVFILMCRTAVIINMIQIKNALIEQ